MLCFSHLQVKVGVPAIRQLECRVSDGTMFFLFCSISKASVLEFRVFQLLVSRFGFKYIC